MISRRLILGTAIATCVLGGACVTMKNNDRIDHKYDHYADTITHFLITNDQKTLIVIGQKHHYFFRIDPKIKAILQHPARAQIQAKFSSWALDVDQSVKGTYDLSIPKHTWNAIPPHEQISLKTAGFREDAEAFYFSGELSGKRYRAGLFQLPPHINAFNRTYPVHIEYHYRPANAGKMAEVILTTPLAVTADGVLVVGFIAVSPFITFATLLLN
jgi:hypothetical protein